MQKLVKVLSFLFFLVSFLILCRALFLDFYPDFTVHYYSPKIIFNGSNPYVAKNESFVPDVYPPISILLFSPFALLPFMTAEKAWTVISLTSLFLSVYLIFRIYKKRIFSALGFAVLGLICLSFPTKFTLGMGQINNFILLLIVLTVYFLNKNKNYLSSFFLAVSFGIKFFPAFILLYFLIIKKWKLLIGFLISFSVLSILAFIALKPDITFYFYQKVLPTLVGGWKTEYYNQSLVGFIGRSFSAGNTREILKDALSLIFFVISFLAIFKSLKLKKFQNMHLSLLVNLNLIVNNFSWQHHFVLMLFPFLVTLFYVQNLKNNLKFIFILFVSYLLISFNLKNPNDVPIIVQSHVFYGAVLLWILQCFLIWKDSHRLQLHSPLASPR